MLTALVAEDNPALARVIVFTLRRGGFEVTQTGNGLEAWDAAQDRTYDLVVTDQQMPEMSGLELCSRLKDRLEYQDTPIILLTAKGMELELERLKESHGVSHMMLKPFSPTELNVVAQDLTHQHA